MERGFSQDFIERSAKSLANAEDEVRYFEALIERYPRADAYKQNLKNALIGLEICHQREAAIAMTRN